MFPTHDYEFYTTFRDETTSVNWLKENQIIHTEVSCSECGNRMGFVEYNEHAFWKCYPFNKTKGIFTGSVFEDTAFEDIEIQARRLLEIIYYWLLGDEPSKLAKHTGIAVETIDVLFQKIRKAIEKYINLGNSPWEHKIGGPGKVVEVDEAKFGERRVNNGLQEKGVLIVGGYERGSKPLTFFMVPVADRSKETMHGLIQKHVAQGSAVITDCDEGYTNIEQYGYTHLTVNHKKAFRDPITGANTNSIRGYWAHTHRFLPPLENDHKLYAAHLTEFMFRKRYQKELASKLFDVLKIQ